jgi:hypothetical protein
VQWRCRPVQADRGRVVDAARPEGRNGPGELSAGAGHSPITGRLSCRRPGARAGRHCLQDLDLAGGQPLRCQAAAQTPQEVPAFRHLLGRRTSTARWQRCSPGAAGWNTPPGGQRPLVHWLDPVYPPEPPSKLAIQAKAAEHFAKLAAGEALNEDLDPVASHAGTSTGSGVARYLRRLAAIRAEGRRGVQPADAEHGAVKGRGGDACGRGARRPPGEEEPTADARD